MSDNVVLFEMMKPADNNEKLERFTALYPSMWTQLQDSQKRAIMVALLSVLREGGCHGTASIRFVMCCLSGNVGAKGAFPRTDKRVLDTISELGKTYPELAVPSNQSLKRMARDLHPILLDVWGSA